MMQDVDQVVEGAVIPVVIQNISQSFPQKAWVSMGMGDDTIWQDGMNGYAKVSDGRVFQVALRGRELFINSDMKPGESLTLECLPSTIEKLPFQFSDWVIDELQKLIPTFNLKTTDGNNYESLPLEFWSGVGAKPQAYYTLEQDLDVRKRFFFHTRIPRAPMTIEGWLDLYSNQDIVPIIIRASYGDISSKAVLNENFGSLSMYTGEKVTIDFRKAKGLHDPIWRDDKRVWETELASPRLWWKARVVECFGALHCMPPYDQLKDWFGKPEFINRINNLKSREEAPVLGIANVWDGQWLAFGKTPEIPTNGANELQRNLFSLLKRLNNYGDEYDKRDYAQPPNSGQTGSQPDFGASRGEMAVSMLQPWALWDYRHSVQAWMLRPYAHKSPNGEAVQAKDHPKTLLWNLAIDDRFGSDFLGFPIPVPYNEFWTGSDNQHRSDNLLFAVYALTRDPSVLATIKDLVQCSLMELKTYEIYGRPKGSISSPRGWGRPLISMAHMLSLGFNEVAPLVSEIVDVMYEGASLNFIPTDDLEHTVKTLSNDGFKYGWNDINGNPIRAWVCWEEAIAVMGLWAVYTATGNQKARDLALQVARTITKHAFFKENNAWYACYAVRWNQDDPGMPLDSSCYKLMANPEDNKDVFVYGMQRWMIPALRILYDVLPVTDPDSKRAMEIMSFFGIRPTTFEDSAWWAVNMGPIPKPSAQVKPPIKPLPQI